MCTHQAAAKGAHRSSARVCVVFLGIDITEQDLKRNPHLKSHLNGVQVRAARCGQGKGVGRGFRQPNPRLCDCPPHDVQTVLLAKNTGSVRATPGWYPRCPSVQAQVECLIDQATDPAILARSWRGLSMWL